MKTKTVRKSSKKVKELRKDAVGNKNNLVLTAIDLYHTKGPEVALSEIAEAAGVSRMTFYRNFPDRSALIEAIFHYNLDELAVYAKSIESDGNAFFKLLETVMKQRAEYNLLQRYLDEKASSQLMLKLIDIFKAPVKKAKKEGALRTDFSTEKDLLLLIVMVAGTFIHGNFWDTKHFPKRAFEFILEGIRP